MGLFFVLLTGLCASASAQVLVWSMGNSQSGTQAVASWLTASGQFSSVTAIDSPSLTSTDLAAYQQLLFFSNSSGDPSAGDVLATFAETGRRLVVATFSWANQGGNTLGGRFISDAISPVTLDGSTLYQTATIGATDGGPLFSGVRSIDGYYRDNVTPTAGAIVHSTWSDGQPMVVSKGNVIAITLFPDDGASNVSGDYRQLFVNALALSAIPEPSTYALLALGLGIVIWLRRWR